MMNDPSLLDDNARIEIAGWRDDYASLIRTQDRHNLITQLQKVDAGLRIHLLKALLPLEVEDIQKRESRLPTLWELTQLYPSLAKALVRLYRSLPSEFRIPTRFGNYEVFRVLGEGGQARIVSAREVGSGESVAIKYNLTPDGAGLIQREKEHLSRAVHPNVIQVKDGKAESPHLFYLVLPYLKGANLQSAFASTRPAAHTALEIVLQVTRAVAHLHALRIVHSDISPANIHLDPDRPADTVQVIDLGLAIDIDSGNLPTPPVYPAGWTRRYAAPEQVAGNATSELTSYDIYAIGGVLCFLLTGQPPDDPDTAKKRITSAKAPAIVKQIALKALRCSPSTPFANTRELELAVTHALQTLTVRRYAKQASLVAGCFTLLVFAGIIIGNWSSRSNAMLATAPPSQLESAAEELGIALEKVSAKDFRVSAVPYREEVGLRGLDFGRDDVAAKLLVEAEEPMSELLAEVEYRIGNRPWRNLHREVSRKGSVGDLTQKDVEAQGPVQLRLDSVPGHAVGQVIGPFSYHIDMAAIIKQDVQDRTVDLKQEWVRSRPPWISRGFGGWELSINRFDLPKSPIQTIHVGVTAAAHDYVVSVAPGSKPPEGTLGDPTFRDYFAELQSRFSLAIQPIAYAPEIYAKLEFTDGSASETVRFEDPSISQERGQEALLKSSRPAYSSPSSLDLEAGDISAETLNSHPGFDE